MVLAGWSNSTGRRRVATEFRQYEQDTDVARFYRLNHEKQTFEFARSKANAYAQLNRGRRGVWETCLALDELVDESDPDTELSQLEHLLQTAEAARQDGRPDWFIAACLIHDLGKVLVSYGEPQWAVTGDTFPVGCPFSEEIVYPEFFSQNPDHGRYESETGVYEPGCGLNEVVMSFGHDEYMYQVARPYLPEAALYMIRFHSFYAWHQGGAYRFLMDAKDAEHLSSVQAFNQYDLYSKADKPPDVAALTPYYRELLDRFFPAMIAW